MRCPICDCSDMKILDSRKRDKYVWRRRECKNCLTVFTTYETIDFKRLPDYLKRKVMSNESI